MIHQISPGANAAGAQLVLLHGTGGGESDLMPLAARLAPGATRFGLRGTVAIEGGYAFFHRHPDRRVDEADLAARAAELVASLGSACARAPAPIAIGFSNGAIMAAALLLAHPGTLAGAILFRPLSPFTHDTPHRLEGATVLILDGETDERRSPGDGARLARTLRRAGATIAHHVLPAGHALTGEDERIAREWLERR